MGIRKVYVDTHIFVDYYWDRKDSMLPLGEFAFNFMRDTINCKYLVIISDCVVAELQKTLQLSSPEVWEEVLSGLRSAGKIEVVVPTTAQESRAEKLASDYKIPKGDALHAVVAAESGAVLISRDWHHAELADLVEIKKPETL